MSNECYKCDAQLTTVYSLGTGSDAMTVEACPADQGFHRRTPTGRAAAICGPCLRALLERQQAPAPAVVAERERLAARAAEVRAAGAAKQAARQLAPTPKPAKRKAARPYWIGRPGVKSCAACRDARTMCSSCAFDEDDDI